MKKLLVTIMIAVFLTSLFAVSPNTTAQTSTSSGRPTLRPKDNDLEGIDGTTLFEALIWEGAQPDTGNPWTIPVSDDYLGIIYDQDFECVLEGVHANIWIGLNPDIWDGGYADEYDDNGTPEIDDDTWYFAYPWSSIGIPAPPDPDADGYYLAPPYRDWITGEDLLYVMDEFDNNIHDTATTFFGMYQDRPGPMDDYKIQILIFNIRDGLFWDPITAPWFIMGYYSYYVSNLNDANIFHMDTYQWWRRLGDPTPPLRDGLSPLPFQYEGTFAHEFQHLIHRDVDFDEYSWVNEGCSTLAEYVCGYGFSPGHISEYLYWFWDTSLTIWEQYLSNYGVVFLWTFYMYEHYGGPELIWDLTHEQANGIEGWNNVLQAHGIKKDFDEIFQDWAIANYLDDTSFAKGIYGYYALDIPSEDTDWWSIPLSMIAWGTYSTDYWDGWFLPERLPYIVWYWELYYGLPELEVYFDGDDYEGVIAHSGDYHWYSDGVSHSWFRLGRTFDLTGLTEATLTFWTYYDIELDYDYGYVEVHDLDTDEWYTLQGLGTIQTVANPWDNPNCPDEYEPTTYLAAGRWNAFTGFSGGYYEEEMDLSDFAGHEIELHFTYWTDPFTLGQGWYIDDIAIPELGFFDDVESGADGWTYAGWEIAPSVIVPNDFEVNFIETLNLANKKGEIRTIHHISPMKLDDETEEGSELLYVVDTDTAMSGPAVMVAANQPGYEHTFGTTLLFIVDDAPFEFIHYWTH